MTEKLHARIEELEKRINVNAFGTQQSLDELQKWADRTKGNFFEIEKRLTTLDTHLQEVRHAPEIDKRMTDLERALADRLKAVEDLIMLLEIEVVKVKQTPSAAAPSFGRDIVPGVPSELEDRIKVIENKFTTLEKMKLKVPTELVEHEPRLKSMEDNILATQAKLRSEISRVESLMSGRALTQPAVEDFIKRIREEMSELKHDVDRAELLKTEIVTREKDLAKRSQLDVFEQNVRKEIESFQSFVKGEIDQTRGFVDRVAAMEKSLDTRLVDIEDKLHDDLESHRRSFDTKIVDLEEKMGSTMKKEARTIMEPEIARLRAEVEKVSEKIKPEVTADQFHQLDSKLADQFRQLDLKVSALEKDFDLKATSILTKELADFAASLDKKFPDLVGKGDFHTFANQIETRVQTIEAPDITPLTSRIDAIEGRIAELTALVRTVAGRMPLVVE